MDTTPEGLGGENEAIVTALYEHLLHRVPAEAELRNWTRAAGRISTLDLIRQFVDSPEYKGKSRVHSFFPAGHYHSPVVDPATVENYVAQRATPGSDGFAGIPIDVPAMLSLWDTTRDSIREAPFPEVKTAPFRFYFDGAPFPYGDALSLHAMIGHFRPRRIVEISSGFSTACMLDSAEVHQLHDLQIKCVEPYPERLQKLLKRSDKTRVGLFNVPVQEVVVQDIIGELNANDILFIDSGHVLKTGSDVHYEIFEILPALRPGVVVHIHDCPYPFEYPPQWIQKNYSWNEAYAVRAFLMFNPNFKIIFWGSLLKRLYSEKVVREGGRFARNSGTSLWLQRVG
jgi:hypothetical protein